MSSSSGSSSSSVGKGDQKQPSQPSGSQPDAKPKFDASFVRGKFRQHIRAQQGPAAASPSRVAHKRNDEDEKTEFERTKAGFHPAVSKHGLRARGNHVPRSPNGSSKSIMGVPSKEPLKKATLKPKNDDDEKTEFERVKGRHKPAISKGLRPSGLRWKAADDEKRKKDTEKSIAEDETIDETKPKEGSARRTKSSSKEARTSDKAVGDRNLSKVTSKGPAKRDQPTKHRLPKGVGDKQQKPKEAAQKQRSSDREAEKTQRSVRSEVCQPTSSTAATTTVATPTSPSTDCPSMLYSCSEADISASAKVDSEQQSDQVSAGYASVPNESPQVEIDDNEATEGAAMANNRATQAEHEEMAVSKTACKALESMHKRALFANLLVDSESESLKKYFDGETPYTEKLLLLLDKAMDKLIDRLKPVENDDELVDFLSSRSTAKNLLVDAILARPAFLPQCWGGRNLDGIIPKDSLMLPSPAARKPTNVEVDEGSIKQGNPFETKQSSSGPASSASSVSSTNAASENPKLPQKDVARSLGALEEHSFAGLPPAYR